MSLEQTIADLVAASNNLTGTINSKMNEIDQKVDEATESVPSAIRSKSLQTFYVDSIVGNDNNPGTESQPVKTWKNGVAPKVIGAFGTEVFFKEDQAHIIERPHNFLIIGAIEIMRWGEATANRPTLKLDFIINNEERAVGSAFILRGGNCRIQGCSIEVINDTGREVLEGQGFIQRAPGSNTIALDDTKIIVKNAPFAHTYGGFSGVTLIIRSVEVTKHLESDSFGRFISTGNISAGHTVRLDASSLSFVNTDIREQLSIKADNSNILTNITLPA